MPAANTGFVVTRTHTNGGERHTFYLNGRRTSRNIAHAKVYKRRGDAARAAKKEAGVFSTRVLIEAGTCEVDVVAL